MQFFCKKIDNTNIVRKCLYFANCVLTYVDKCNIIKANLGVKSMKKFLMYVIVLVTVLFVGYTAYYFIRNNENIYLSLAENDRTIYMNVGESQELPIVWEKPYSTTTVYENVDISNQDVVDFDVENKMFTAKAGGTTTVTVTPSNDDFGPFTFTIAVGDGSVLYPYYVRTDLELTSIGTPTGTVDWDLTDSYILVNDIDLRLYSDNGFTPIGSVTTPFSGVFDGNGHTISNLSVKSGNSAGLFGYISASGVVQNLTLTNVTVSGNFDYAGSVAGYSSGTVRLCNVENLQLTNIKQNSSNGGLVGYVVNNSTDGVFTSAGYIDMCNVTVSAETAGDFGGLAGNLIGSVIYNSKVEITSYTQQDGSTTFGGLAGVVENATGTNEYMFSVLKNSLALVNSVNLLDNSNLEKGAIVGQNVDESNESYANIYKGLLYNTVNTTLGQSYGHERTMNQLYTQATYQDDANEINWDFDNVWTIVEGSSVADIKPFNEAMPQALNEYIPGDEVNSAESLEAVLDGIRNNPSSGATYEITESIVLDLNGEEWNTLAPNAVAPMTASIICADGVTITIKNARISGTNSSFFGYVSGVNTRIENIIFENITVNSNAQTVALVATGVLDNAVLDNIDVVNCNIQTGDATRNLAVIAGTNNGTITNCNVNSGVLNQNTVTSPSTSLVVGGIVSDNARLVENCTIEMYDFDITTPSTTASLEYGGIAGKNSGTLRNCYNYDASLDVTFNGNVYAGGVVGRLEDGLIEKCFSEALVSVSYTNTKSYVGGIAGHSENAIIRQSYYASQTLQGANVGGIVATSNASIDQCYFQGEIKAVRAGGIAMANNNSITNCYVTGTLEGMTSSSKISGICSTLPVGSSVNHCFSSATFKGQGERHAETEAEFRATIEKVGQLFGYYPDTGTFENCIIINYGDAYVKGTFFGWRKPGWIDCSENQALGLEGDYSVFKNTAGFDQGLWVFDNNQGQGAYPTLAHVVVNNR